MEWEKIFANNKRLTPPTKQLMQQRNQNQNDPIKKMTKNLNKLLHR